jgi:hypothetical protein
VRGRKLIPVGGLARLLWACPSPAPDTPTGLNPVDRFADKLRADRRAHQPRPQQQERT